MKTIDTSIMDAYMSEKRARAYSRRVERENRKRFKNQVEHIKFDLCVGILFLLAILADTIMFQAGMF